MLNIRSIDMLFLDDLFEMGGGYVLNFSDRTFAEFFAEELKINIDAPKYALGGTSKGKRLRYFLQNADKPTTIRTLNALWEYREAVRMRGKQEDQVPNAHARLQDLVHRLGGPKPSVGPARPEPSKPRADPDRLTRLSADLIELSKLPPQPRGYAFERFLKELFDVHGMEGRSPFRVANSRCTAFIAPRGAQMSRVPPAFFGIRNFWYLAAAGCLYRTYDSPAGVNPRRLATSDRDVALLSSESFDNVRPKRKAAYRHSYACDWPLDHSSIKACRGATVPDIVSYASITRQQVCL